MKKRSLSAIITHPALLEKVLCKVISVTKIFATAAVVPLPTTLAKIGSVKTIVSTPKVISNDHLMICGGTVSGINVLNACAAVVGTVVSAFPAISDADRNKME